ncbi:MAG: putative holliday junction resolvase [Candidatus Peregrinibacteria bacterium Greene0416_62]|nr:MAG: putative holliday junction resolvase [Candidatus Peregrinibacteria bacterium Greene0416_62]TSC99724.1 MAG: putative holliday junction resolvase [Candidatus Peregrinibacteria bacterium Greene1014_49]
MSPISETLLCFDIGTRHTGVAISFAGSDMAVTKETINHTSLEELLEGITALMNLYHSNHCILGLPRLPTGIEGKQAAIVRTIGAKLAQKGQKVSYIDERYTTPRNSQYDGNAAAACTILNTFLDQNRNLT